MCWLRNMKRLLLILGFLLCARSAFAVSVPTLVQCTSQINNNMVTNGTVTLSFTPTIGNVLVYSGTQYDTIMSDYHIVGASDSQSNSYTLTARQAMGTANHIGTTFAGAAKVDATQASLVITLTSSGGTPANSQLFTWKVCEFSWPDPTAYAFDQSGGNENNGGTSLTITATMANANAQDLVVAVGVYFTSSPPSGYTSLWTDSTVFGVEAVYKVTSGIETSSVAWTGLAMQDLYGVLITLKAPPAAGGASNNMLLLGVQ